MEIRVLVPVAHGTEELEAVTVVDLLRRAGMNVKVAGETGIITCSRGIKLLPDILIEEIENDMEFDLIVLPGGADGAQNLSDNEHLKEILEHHRNQGKTIAAICAAPLILASHSLIGLNDSITSHPSVSDQLSAYDYREDAVVVGDRVITSRGAGTAIPFALSIINKYIDTETARRVSREIMYE